MPEYAKVPDHILSQVKAALGRLQDARERLDRVRDLDKRLGSQGRYEAESYESIMNETDRRGALDTLSEFGTHAPKHGIDPNQVIEELGGYPDLSLTKAAAEFFSRNIYFSNRLTYE